MELDTMGLIFRFIVSLVAFLFFIGVVKFWLKKRLNGERVWLAGFIIGFIFAFMLFAIGNLYYSDSSIFQLIKMSGVGGLFGFVVVEGIVFSLAFVLYYFFGKQLYKERSKIIKKHGF